MIRSSSDNHGDPNAGAAGEKSAISPPAITLPKGGGARFSDLAGDGQADRAQKGESVRPICPAWSVVEEPENRPV